MLWNSFGYCRGRFKDFEKVGLLYVSHHVWLPKKILYFRWSKKAQITLETTSFWQNTYISIFKFSPFLSIKSYQFSKFTNGLIRKEKKTLIQQSMRKEKLRKIGLCFKTGCLIKPFRMIIIFFYLSSSFAVQLSLFDIRDIKRGNWQWQIAREDK